MSGPCWAIQPTTSESSARSSAEVKDSAACWGERGESTGSDRWRSKSSVTMPVENTAAISPTAGPAVRGKYPRSFTRVPRVQMPNLDWKKEKAVSTR